MKRSYVIGILFATLAFAGSARLSAQNSNPVPWQEVLIPDGQTVYDTVNHVTWLVEFNLPATERFDFPLCYGLDTDPEKCIFASGAMNYETARAWINAMNTYQDPTINHVGYLGHSDWQLPSAPLKDPDCSGTGPKPYREGFAFNCDAGALDYLYKALGFTAPATAVPIPPNTVGPFSNFQPNVYWSDSAGGGLTCTIANFNFANGAQGGGCGGDFGSVLPMIDGEISGAPAHSTFYDSVTDKTWLADANVAANWVAGSNPTVDTLGLPLCVTAPDKTPCVALDGSMNYESAQQLIKNMNAYDNGPGISRGYLLQHKWQLPPVPAKCRLYNCKGTGNPLGELFYTKLGKVAGEPVVEPPDIAVGPFQDIQPFPYWSCLADSIQDFCYTDAYEPSADSEWGFSFSTGYLGTSRLAGDHYVTAYFQGCDLSSCQTITFPSITATEVVFSSLALSATASSGLSVSFTSMTPKVCTVSGNTASLLLSGDCTIEASQPGNDSFYSALSIQRTFTVNGLEQKITFPPIPTQEVGDELQLKATASSGLTVALETVYPSSQVIILTVTPHFVCYFWGSILRMSNPGTCEVTASQAGNDIYAPAKSITRDFTVVAAP